MVNTNSGVSGSRIATFLSAFPDEFVNLTDKEGRISIRIYRLLIEGLPVTIDKIAASLELQKNEVDNLIKTWPGVIYNEKSEIIGYWGLTLKKTTHRFNVDGKTLYTWCAWDSLFIPRIIQKTVHVESKDPVTKNIIEMTVSPDDISNITPANAVVSFIVPDADKIRMDLITSFCHYVHFFSSAETASQWISMSDKKEEMLWLAVDEAFDLGQRKNWVQYRDMLESDA